MNKYNVLLVTNDEVKVIADSVSVDSGALVFYKNGIKTEEDKYPEPITVMIFAAITWTLVTLDEE